MHTSKSDCNAIPSEFKNIVNIRSIIENLSNSEIKKLFNIIEKTPMIHVEGFELPEHAVKCDDDIEVGVVVDVVPSLLNRIRRFFSKLVKIVTNFFCDF